MARQRYILQKLPEPTFRSGALFDLVILRLEATKYEPALSPVFYFFDSDEAAECLVALNGS